MKIISGGQTGVDRAALIAAKSLGLNCGGWMPKGFLAHDGFHPEFADDYCMKEHTSPIYPPRTKMNVMESDGTLRIAEKYNSAGERMTLKAITHFNKPWFDVQPNTKPEAVVDWLIKKNIQCLNVAGNSERTAPGIQEFATTFLITVFRIWKERIQKLAD